MSTNLKHDLSNSVTILLSGLEFLEDHNTKDIMKRACEKILLKLAADEARVSDLKKECTRQFKRYNVRRRTTVKDLHGALKWDMQIQNISQGGAKLSTNKLEMDKIYLFDFESRYNEMTIPAKVVWKSEDSCGIEFVPTSK